jgi:peptidoglycan/xylan/chitin deacetylase (PgdA/CDA1 family)
MKKRLAALLLILCLLSALPAVSSGEALQPCHKVTNSYTDKKNSNKSVVRLWQVETALPSVTEEVNGIASAWASELGPDLPKAANNTGSNSRLDVEIRYSRTGLRWLSFLVQARTIYHRKLTDQRIETRTYNMETGDRVTLADIFGDDVDAWDFVENRVRETLSSYWPDIEPDAAKLDALCTPGALEEADFTLHGMSLVLHYPASLLYDGKYTLMEVTFYYPEIRDFLTPEAYAETDNTKYYKTCALTFDDGPHGTNTANVLTALLEVGARGTFFVIGNRVTDYYWLVQREQDNGHAVASHNWTHGDVRNMSAATLRAMPEKVNKAMVKTIGIPVRYNRVPGGLYPNMVKAGVDWALIQWSLDTYDWRGYSSSIVLNKVKKKLQDGDIILCHDVKPNTAESARRIVRYAEEQGYMLLTIDELFAKDGVSLVSGEVYYRCADGGDTSKRSDP